MSDASRTVGTGRNAWAIDALGVELGARRAPRPAIVRTGQLPVRLDLDRTAMVVIDMQNAFCAPGGLTDLAGRDLAPVRAPIAPLQSLLPVLRGAGVPVIWLNWGNRPDRLNLPPMTLQAFDPTGHGRGIGGLLPDEKGPVLIKDSWSAAIVAELRPEPTDIQVDKYRVSGFWDTPLDSILRNLDIRTLLFAGVNLDVCVYHTLADAHCLGYDCLLVEDCAGTTAPQFCTDATVHNIVKCFGFVTDATALVDGIGASPTP